MKILIATFPKVITVILYNQNQITMTNEKIEGIQKATSGPGPGTLWENASKRDSHIVSANTDQHEPLKEKNDQFSSAIYLENYYNLLVID